MFMYSKLGDLSWTYLPCLLVNSARVLPRAPRHASEDTSSIDTEAAGDRRACVICVSRPWRLYIEHGDVRVMELITAAAVQRLYVNTRRPINESITEEKSRRLQSAVYCWLAVAGKGVNTCRGAAADRSVLPRQTRMSVGGDWRVATRETASTRGEGRWGGICRCKERRTDEAKKIWGPAKDC
jgi:hypothetical protein